MQILSIALGLFFASSFIQTAKGFNCDSGCSACWKNNNADGVDVKIACDEDTGQCNTPCPDGYNGLHCAKSERCR